jgi:hypothetical protein
MPRALFTDLPGQAFFWHPCLLAKQTPQHVHVPVTSISTARSYYCFFAFVFQSSCILIYADR